MDKYYEERICANCHKKFKVPKTDSKSNNGRPIGVRPKSSINCSRKCSREYFLNNNRLKRLKEKNE